MSTLTFAGLLLLLSADPTAAPQRRYHELSHELSAVLRQESSANDLTERGAAVRQLVALYQELDRDPRTPTSEALQEYRSKARGRLVSVQAKLKRELNRRHKAADRHQSSHPLDQIMADDQLHALAQQLTAQVTLANYTSGGPSQIFAAAGAGQGGGIVRDDHGEELVELIETTIAPQSWVARGGPGTIVYYQPLMCLVVRATGSTHREVGGLLNALRGAGP